MYALMARFRERKTNRMKISVKGRIVEIFMSAHLTLSFGAMKFETQIEGQII